MSLRSFSLLALAALLCSATPLHKRAGAPAITPIPSNCTVANPLPHAACSVGGVSGYKLSDDFNSTNLVYEAYYDSSESINATYTQCIEQCYGYGEPGTCKSALLAYNVPIPAGYHGVEGGNLSPTACIMYGDYPSPDDFEPALDGQYVNETVGNIYCGFY